MIRLDGLDIQFDDARESLTISHPLVAGQPLEIGIPKAAICEDLGSRLLQLELHANQRVRVIPIEGISTPSVLVAIRDALADLGMVSASVLVGRYHNELVRALGKETRRNMRPHAYDGKILTSDIESLMEAVDRARSEIVPCLMGPSGIGKTEGIEAFAKRHGRQVVHLIASQVLPTEVSGMTMPNQETHSMDVFDHSRISHMRDGDILFLDELLKGQQQVLSACLTMVQERRLMSGTPLPDVIIVAAANPLASPKMLPLEIRQRFLFVEVEFDKRSWCRYMREKGVPSPERMLDVLVTSHEGSDWNTLTPRTATKLALWLRSVTGTESETTVRRVIGGMFGGEVLNDIAASLIEDDVKEETRTPLVQVTDRMSELIGGLPATSDPKEAAARMELLASLSRMSSRGDCSSVSELLERIGNLSGGSEILRALGEETIVMPTNI